MPSDLTTTPWHTCLLHMKSGTYCGYAFVQHRLHKALRHAVNLPVCQANTLVYQFVYRSCYTYFASTPCVAFQCLAQQNLSALTKLVNNVTLCFCQPHLILPSQACADSAHSLLRTHAKSAHSLHVMQETETQVHGFVRKSQALASALQQQGRTPAAVTCLGSSISLLASLGIDAHGAAPLVQSLVTARAKLHSVTDEDTADAQKKLTGKAGSRCGEAAHIHAERYIPNHLLATYGSGRP